MKKIFVIALSAAMLGSILVLGGAKALGFIGNTSTTIPAPAFQDQVKFASLNGQSTPVNMNFTAAASKTLPVVVNIQSATRMQSQRGGEGLNLPEPFRQYFSPRMFRDQSPNSGRKNNEEVQMGTGSGVIISPDGYIVTNNHVVVGADELMVTLNDKRAFKAKVIGTDPSTDLGLIKIEASALPFINFSNSDAVQVGEWVLAVGNPFNLGAIYIFSRTKLPLNHSSKRMQPSTRAILGVHWSILTEI
jgi:serine protease Do